MARGVLYCVKCGGLARKRKDVDAILGLHDGVFPLGAERAIAGDSSPTVAESLGTRAADVEHRFDREHVTDFNERATFVVAEVVDCRFFVEAATKPRPMPCPQ